MTAANPKFGIVLVIATPLLLVFAYYCAWQAGLRFDSKQGIGDFGSATPWSIAALAAIVLSWLSASLAAPLLAGPTLWRTVGSLLFFGIILLPLGVLVLLSAESAGVQAGGP
jgi:hypothetical protein